MKTCAITLIAFLTIVFGWNAYYRSGFTKVASCDLEYVNSNLVGDVLARNKQTDELVVVKNQYADNFFGTRSHHQSSFHYLVWAGFTQDSVFVREYNQ